MRFFIGRAIFLATILAIARDLAGRSPPCPVPAPSLYGKAAALTSSGRLAPSRGESAAREATSPSCMLSRMSKPDLPSTEPAPEAAESSSLPPGPPQVNFRMRIRRGDTVALGPGKVTLLEAVREHGSISAAARHLGMSYRRAWLLIDELNRSLRAPATHSEQGGASGGGCTLTPVGEKIIALYREIEEEAKRHCDSQIAELTDLMQS